MAGRGRGATLPAWMTQQAESVKPPQPAGPMPTFQPTSNFSNAPVHHPNIPAPAKYENKKPEAPHGTNGHSHHERDVERSRDYDGVKERDKKDREKDKRRDRDRDSDRRSYSRDRGSRRRSRSRSHSREKRKRDRSPSDSVPKWKSRNKQSNFDVRPPDGVILPPIGGTSLGGDPFANAIPVGPGITRDNSATTKHARRIYVGGIPQTSTEHEIGTFFNDICRRGLRQEVLPNDSGPPVMNVYLNLDKCFAFVEMPSIEIATAAQKLDGILYKHYTGPCTLRIRRPHDYKAELVGETGPIPEFNLPEFQVIGTTVGDGPGKIFVGGLPNHLHEEQVKELLSAFGPLKSFNLVRDPGAALTKGYGFCEYFDEKTSLIAVQGLNDMQIGEKRLTVRVAETRTAPGANPFSVGGVTLPGGSSQSIPTTLLTQTPTKVLRLENMVSSEELRDNEEYEDILNDVREECSQYGVVHRVLIPRAVDGFPQHTEGFIFVLFADIDSSVRAALKLYGRKFAERTVMVNYFDELKFQNGILV